VKITLSSAEGGEIILALVGRGGFFGELALLDGEPRSANAVARTTCELLALERNHFLHFLERHPRAAASLLAALSRRLRRTTELMHETAFFDVAARLASMLLQLSEARSQPGPDGAVGSPRLTQEELAQLIGATRVSVNKWLAVYEREGLVRRHKGFVTVLHPEGLRLRFG
jgi:CRP/FNR family transcriptional regulator, cyclic AMP receptor protein